MIALWAALGALVGGLIPPVCRAAASLASHQRRLLEARVEALESQRPDPIVERVEPPKARLPLLRGFDALVTEGKMLGQRCPQRGREMDARLLAEIKDWQVKVGDSLANWPSLQHQFLALQFSTAYDGTNPVYAYLLALLQLLRTAMPVIEADLESRR